MPATPRDTRLVVGSCASIAVLLLAGCATLVPPASPPAATGSVQAPRVHPASPIEAAPAKTDTTSAPGAAGAVARPDPAAPKPFAEVTRGATEMEGFFPLWRKDEKVWIEIPEARWNQPFLLTINVASSVGQRGLYASQMGRSWMAQFRRIGNQVQLIARNVDYRAEGNPALQRAIREGFSDSLLGATPVASGPHPERKSVLIDGAFLLGDIAGYSNSIESAFRLNYSFDRPNSYFERVASEAGQSSLAVRTHFSTSRIPAQPPAGSLTMPAPPSVTPDPRSFFVGFVYNFLALPDPQMRPRRADPRIGHFTEAHTDLAIEEKPNPRIHHINRWRLEKKDPQAAMSEPVQPIVFWLDQNIPVRYRAAVEAGVLEWNKAFERIGFRDALVVRQQPDDADWDGMDARHASIRWYVSAEGGSARGPHHSDPRTGEILDADIAMSDVFARSSRRFVTEQVTAKSDEQQDRPGHGWSDHRLAQCGYEVEAAAQMGFVLDLLEARGDIVPDGPQAEAFVQGVIKDTVMHEVGHALGLTHNFKASTTVTQAQLGDREFTGAKGISGSVMDYNAYNVALQGEPQGDYNNTTLGPYDYWAIEYAYKQVAPEQEEQELRRIAARSAEPRLAFGDDYDAGGMAGFDASDPMVNRFDLGDDPLAYYERRLKLAQELWQRLQAREAQPADDPARSRRVLLSGFGQVRSAADQTAKYVGGMLHVRDLPGSGARPNYTPVDPAKQRQALQFLTRHLFSAENFRFKPEFLRSLPPDYLDRSAAGPVPLPSVVLGLQSTALDRLMSAGTASRVLDLPNYLGASQRNGILTLNEVYRTVQDAVWSELRSRPRSTWEISPLRRNLQREHLKRVVSPLTHGSALPPDALSLVRYNATRLQAELQQASQAPGASVETQAHVQDSLALLTEALRASMTRQ